jgi:hypothetical protein
MSSCRLSVLIPLLPPHKMCTRSSKTHPPLHSSFIRLREDFQSERASSHHFHQARRGTDVVPVLKHKDIQSAIARSMTVICSRTAYLHARKSAGCISRTHVANSGGHGDWKNYVLGTDSFQAYQRNHVSRIPRTGETWSAEQSLKFSFPQS